MNIIYILLLSVLINITAFGAPAIKREILFTQPDGTHFNGRLKGDSSFHWIESNGDIIIYNPKDNYYYKAIVDKNKGLIISAEKAASSSVSLRGLNNLKNTTKGISSEVKEKLDFLYKKSKAVNGPR